MENVCKFFKGRGISKEDLSDTGNPCILYGELYTTYKTAIAKTIKSKTLLDLKSLVHSKSNDVLIPCSGETAEDISTSVCIPYDDVLIGGDLTIIRSQLNGAFLSNQINSVRKLDIAKIAQGKSIVHIQADELKKINISFPTIDEQLKIATFVDLLDQRIDTQSKIIEDLECQINYIRRKLFTGYINDDVNNQKYIFNKIFISYKKLNEQSLQQYTIGKNGIKSMSNHLNYSINSHIVFMPNTLILGIGIDEIGVSIDTTGCCSPIYKTYTINNEIVDTLFLNIFANDYFSMIKNRVTQKSTRREFEFDYKELAKTLFTLPDIEIQKKDAQIVKKFYFKLQKEKDILELYKKQKAYLLKNMFI